MRVLVVGNMGYVGPVLARELRSRWNGATLIGLDAGWFAHCLTTHGPLPETVLDEQLFADVRDLRVDTFPSCDAVVYLAGLSNDVLGNLDEELTLEINHRAAVRAAELARRAGARAFVYASSCSVYGAAGDAPRSELADVQPLTAYARSKVLGERSLAQLASESFLVTSLRFGTACGMSERLRLDLVLNDFVAAAVSSGTIRVFGNGALWRPLIDVQDMARATAWAITRTTGEPSLVVNVGSAQCTVRIDDLASMVAAEVPGTTIWMNPEPAPDRRSYRLDFSRFRALAPEAQPRMSIAGSVRELIAGLHAAGEFRRSRFVRHETLEELRAAGRLDESLRWILVDLTTRHPESAKRDEGSRNSQKPAISRSFAVSAAQDDERVGPKGGL